MTAIYKEAGRIVDRALKKEASVKNLCLSSRHKNKRKLYALSCETLKHRVVLDKILSEVTLEEEGGNEGNNSLSTGLAWVLVNDLLFGHGVQCGGRFQRLVSSREAKLREALAKAKAEEPDVDAVELGPEMPRYARVNTIKGSLVAVLRALHGEKFTKLTGPIKSAASLSDQQFLQDTHVTNLLVFPHGTDLHSHPLYCQGRLILQEKASCFPAAELAPPPGAHVIDACAAPGNKTTHLAALMKNSGKVFAFDINPKRFAILQETCRRAGATCVKSRLFDFLKVNVDDKRYSNVTHILLDPSCSGSGMTNRLDHLIDGSDGKASLAKRLARLAAFQRKAVLHALSFPAVTDVVYSTCSIHCEENEAVVTEVLATHGDSFKLVHAMPSWHRRGNSSYACGSYCLRACPDDDTNGFFVAHFRRKESTMTSAQTAQEKHRGSQVTRGKIKRPQHPAPPPTKSPSTTAVKHRRKRQLRKPITSL